MCFGGLIWVVIRASYCFRLVLFFISDYTVSQHEVSFRQTWSVTNVTLNGGRGIFGSNQPNLLHLALTHLTLRWTCAASFSRYFYAKRVWHLTNPLNATLQLRAYDAKHLFIDQAKCSLNCSIRKLLTAVIVNDRPAIRSSSNINSVGSVGLNIESIGLVFRLRSPFSLFMQLKIS